MKKKYERIPVSVGFIALGCPKNKVDSEVMLAQIGQDGFVLSSDPDTADVVVINTCGFIEPAKEEALDAIRQAVEQKKNGFVRKVVVTGCLSERMGEDLAREVKGIDAVVGLGERDKIAKIIRKCLSTKKYARTQVHIEHSDSAIHDDRGRLLISPQHWAYLRISEGCNRKCSFCTIPAIRGKFRSKPQDMILSEAAELVDSGAVELSIIAQDSNFYGRDRGIKNGLIALLAELEKIDPLKWIRLMYLYPAGINDALIKAIADSEKIVPYIDMPIQHINDDILKSMRRTDTKEHTTELISKLRQAMPDVVLRTTLIAGYPGETDAQFDELLEFIKWAEFDALGCFPFYPEPSTAAAELADQLPDSVKQQRVDTIMRTQQERVFAKMDTQISRELTVLVDEVFENEATGRYYGQAPHIDSTCKIKNCPANPGDFIQTKITARDDYDFLVKQQHEGASPPI
ncbi:MAG: ribosomal protein S12 methylthiotransferase RimO [Planctomycetales bacterium 4572_13]|nr:MAG: ribosomal protein S12 methylthiotransferase RimO [Planctomycetales bacterium 4572_13]